MSQKKSNAHWLMITLIYLSGLIVYASCMFVVYFIGSELFKRLIP